MRILLLVPALLLACILPARAEEAAPAKAAFAVYPITSELQRAQLGRSKSETPRLRAYVAISGNELVNEKRELRKDALPVDEIKKALASYADPDQGIVFISTTFGNEPNGELRTPSDAAQKSLQALIVEMGRGAGFQGCIPSFTYAGATLDQQFAAVTAKTKGRADEDEKPSGDALVTVYPVRSVLSLLFTDNADCIVDVHPILDKDTDPLLSPEIRDAIKKHVAAVTLRDKDLVLVRVKSSRSAISEDRFDRFVNGELKELGPALGFQVARTQHTPFR